jgi:hypothetical protein
MKLQDVTERLAKIKAMASADESAHAEQDDLYEEVLTAIANGDTRGTSARALAQEALKVREIEFSRWYA